MVMKRLALALIATAITVWAQPPQPPMPGAPEWPQGDPRSPQSQYPPRTQYPQQQSHIRRQHRRIPRDRMCRVMTIRATLPIAAWRASAL